jgi:hypothetical protein
MSEVGLLGHAIPCQVRPHEDGIAKRFDLTKDLLGRVPHEDMGAPLKKQSVGKVGCNKSMHAQRNAKEMV